MMAGAIDVCNFDASWGGGPTEWRRVAALASAFTVEMGHHEEPQIAAHLLASVAERHLSGNVSPGSRPDVLPAGRQSLAASRTASYQVPEGPGFGLELDEAAIEKYRV